MNLIDNAKHQGKRKKLISALKSMDIESEKVLQAMLKVPRHYFLDSSFEDFAYQNKAFPIGTDQTISHPYTVAFQSEVLNINKGDKVLEIGKNYNLNCIERPKHLADDKVWTQKVINHTDKHLGKLDDEDVIVVLQANSPQMTSDKIDECIEMLISEDLWQVNTVDSSMINNGAIQVLKRKVKKHKGKVNYNGVVLTDWLDIHTIDDVKELESII